MVVITGHSVSLTSIVPCRGTCTPAVYMYTCTINGGDLSAVDIVHGWKVMGKLSIYTSL